MAKGFVQLRRGALPHWPDMTDGEIRMWTGMLMHAKAVGPHAGKVFGSTSELMDILGFRRRETFLSARKRLEKRGWLVTCRSAANQHETSAYRLPRYHGSDDSKAVENHVESPLRRSGKRTSGGPAADQRRTSGGPATPPKTNNPIELLASNTLDTEEKKNTLKNPLDEQPLEQIRLMRQVLENMKDHNPGRDDLLIKLKRYTSAENADVRASARDALRSFGVQTA